MPINDFQVPPEMSEDLLRFVEHANELESVFKAAQSCNPASNIRTFSTHVEREAQISPGVVFPVLSVLTGLHQFCEAADVDPDELIDVISCSLTEKGDPWTNDKVSKWNSCKTAIATALQEFTDDSPLNLSAKTGFLTYDRPNVLHRTRIITDVRPVFDDEAESIKGMVITHSLVIGYSETSSRKEAYFTLDAEDIRTLREQCERAERKQTVVAESLKDDRWRTMIIPESEA